VVALDSNWPKLKTVNRAAPRVYEISRRDLHRILKLIKILTQSIVIGSNVRKLMENPDLLVHDSCNFFTKE